MAKPTSGPETPADGAPYIFFVTGGAFEPVVTEVPPERKFNSAFPDIGRTGVRTIG